MTTATISSNSNDDSGINSINSNLSNGNSTPANTTATADTATDFNTNNNNNSNNNMAMVGVVTKLFAQQNIHDVPSAMLESVTSEDREESLYDVHGVSTPIHETPELVQTKLLELAFQLINGSQHQNHKQKQNSIYEESSTISSISDDCSATTTSSSSSASCFLDNTKVHNLYRQTAQSSPEFMQRLMLSCLRAESFHVSKAAVRVLRHFEAKCKFFGPELVGTDLGVEHLTGGLAAPGLLVRQALEDGGIQVLRHRDRSGRAIILQCTRVCKDYDPNEVLSKLLFWSGIMATRDEEISKRGIVYIMWRFKQDDSRDDSNERVPPLVATFPCMPARVAAVHFCTDDFSLTEACTKSIPLLESRYRCRLRTHFGSSRECRNNLTTFGIPFDALPMLDDGISLDLKYHKQWIQNASSTTTTTTSSTTSSRTPFQFQEGGGDGDGGALMGTELGHRNLSTLPIREDHDDNNEGTIRLDLHHAWLARLIQAEEQQERQQQQHDDGNTTTSSLAMDPCSSSSASPPPPPSPPIFQPGPLDIIMGRGLRGRKYPGNQIFKRLLEERRKEYDSTSRLNKAGIVKEVYMILRRKHGCRFLSPAVTTINETTGETIITEWVEVSEKESLDRISHGFRNLRNKK